MTITHVTLPTPEPNPQTTETYLGDGLYASWDGWQIQLRAPREGGDHFVYLEPPVQVELVKFIGILGLETLTFRSGRNAPPSA